MTITYTMEVALGQHETYPSIKRYNALWDVPTHDRITNIIATQY